MEAKSVPLRIITAPEALDALVPAWQVLISKVPSATVFQTPEWALGWWRSRARNSIPYCFAMWDQDRLVGLAPLYLAKYWGTRALRFMGTPFDFANRVLVESAYAQIFAGALAESLREHAQEWDVLRLAELADGDNSLSRTCVKVSPEVVCRELSSNTVPVLNLPEQWAEYWNTLSPVRRKNLKKARRRLETRGALSFQVLTTPETVAGELDNFFRARAENLRVRRRWNQRVVFDRPAAYWDTLSRVCVELAASGRVWLAKLQVDAHPVSWVLAFRVNETLSDFMTTYDVNFANHSPGQLAFQEMILYAITQGIRCYELGRGAQPFKFWFHAASRTNKNLVLFWRRPRSVPFLGQQVAREETFKLLHTLRHGQFFSSNPFSSKMG